jgi:hypothetical protein
MNITSYQCKICGNTENNNVVIAREMMFGFRDEFKYFKCSFCGCLQIVEYPEDLSGYYPETYYSYKSVVVHSKMLRRIFFDFYWYLNLPLLNLSFLRLGWLQSLQKI